MIVAHSETPCIPCDPLSIPSHSFHSSHFLNHSQSCACLTHLFSLPRRKGAVQSKEGRSVHAFTVRQLIQLLLKDLLERKEYLNLVGFLDKVEMGNNSSFLVIKDFEFDERVVIKGPSSLLDLQTNRWLEFTHLSLNNQRIELNPESTIRILNSIPSHEIESRIPFFVDFPWFSPQFYLWIHVDIETVYKFQVTDKSCFCCFFANTLHETIHVYSLDYSVSFRTLKGECVYDFLRMTAYQREQVQSFLYQMGCYDVSFSSYFRQYLNTRHSRVVL